MSATLLVSMLLSGWQLSKSPFAAPLVDRTASELRAELTRLTADFYTPDQINVQLTEALNQTPADWPLILSLEEVAKETGHAIPPDIKNRMETRRKRERSRMGLARNCMACLAGRPSCRAGDAVPCLVGIELVPVVSDGRILVIEATNKATGREVDFFNVGLATVGLAATAGILVSGGSSAALKGATAVLRTGRATGAMTAKLALEIGGMARKSVRLDGLVRAGALDITALGKAVDVKALGQLAKLGNDIGRIGRAMPPGQTLRLMRSIDSAADARRMARVAEASGPRTLALVHGLGKTRVLRAMLKVSNLVWDTLMMLIGTAVQALSWLAMMVLRRFAGV